MNCAFDYGCLLRITFEVSAEKSDYLTQPKLFQSFFKKNLPTVLVTQTRGMWYGLQLPFL